VVSPVDLLCVSGRVVVLVPLTGSKSTANQPLAEGESSLRSRCSRVAKEEAGFRFVIEVV
jgi:hypothetical protein